MNAGRTPPNLVGRPTCTECGAAYAVTITRCPRCHNTEFREVPMAKISAAGGPSDAITGEGLPTPKAPTEPEATGPVEMTTDDGETELAGDGTGEALPDFDPDAGEREAGPRVVELVEEDETSDAPTPGPVKPEPGDLKSLWLAYAQAIHPDEDLSHLTKADLIELYGGEQA